MNPLRLLERLLDWFKAPDCPTCGMCGTQITQDNKVVLSIYVGPGKELIGPLCEECDQPIRYFVETHSNTGTTL